MELFFFIVVFLGALYLLLGRDDRSSRHERQAQDRLGSADRTAFPPTRNPKPRYRARPAPSASRILRGRAWVVDGDTIIIDKVSIRIAGIDAPEMDQPYGIKSKYAMMAICKGRTITAEVMPETSYDRVVAKCLLPDGTDIAALLVAQGLALDWAKFSGGVYRPLEPEGVRRKLWRVEAKHRGQMWRIEADRARRAART